MADEFRAVSRRIVNAVLAAWAADHDLCRISAQEMHRTDHGGSPVPVRLHKRYQLILVFFELTQVEVLDYSF